MSSSVSILRLGSSLMKESASSKLSDSSSLSKCFNTDSENRYTTSGPPQRYRSHTLRRPHPTRCEPKKMRKRRNEKCRSVPEHDGEGEGAQEDVHVPLGRVHGCLDARLGLAIAVNVNKSKPERRAAAGGRVYEVSVEGGEVALEQLFVHGEALEQSRKALQVRPSKTHG